LAQQDLNHPCPLRTLCTKKKTNRNRSFNDSARKKQVQKFLLIKGIYSSMLERTTEMNFLFRCSKWERILALKRSRVLIVAIGFLPLPRFALWVIKIQKCSQNY
jgi:hypothetical protein